MTETYQAQQDRATALITRKGGPATLHRQGASTGGDAWNPTPGTVTDYAVTIVETSASIQRNANTTIRNGDKVGIMAVPSGVTPAVADAITIGGSKHQIIALQPVQPNPAGVVVIYEFQARQQQ